ncbi:hypothetical protein [Parasphingorhabdus sp.]|uniref:hypothetical protein n=1 Tax=Parasphingorhabdus sp. TaxID=2709688 RepID=UPI0030010E40
MTRHIFMVVTRPPPGETEEYGKWYVEQHIPHVLDVPGFVSAQRFLLAPGPDETSSALRYLAIYEIETDDIATVLDELGARAGSNAMPLYAGSDAKMVMRLVGEAVTPKILRPES